ncbi:MAG: type IV pilus secretin PilQ [Bacteriovoracaceae bacterium]|nr:type IV pilus secretin PilQ [Bacteriovoracaceae bacterium]
MKKGFFLTSVLILSCNLFAGELQFIHFKQEGEVSKLELEFSDDNIVANKFHNGEDKQLIIDLKGTSASERVIRGFDTSEFTGSIVYVKAYSKKTSPTDLRVALQLRENVRSLMQKRGNRLILTVENRFGVFTQNKIEAEGGSTEVSDKGGGAVRIHIPRSDSIQDILANITMSGPKKYIGKKISLNVKSISVEDILNMVAESSGFNVIITDEVRRLPALTLTLTSIPWDQILDTILTLNKLVAQKNGAILLITSLEKATKEKKLEIEALKLTKKEEPLVTKVFPLSFGTTKDMGTIVKNYLTKDRGALSSDERTNSLIVRDTADTLEKIRKIIEVLDTQTPQVLIESKIIEVNEDYSRNIGLKNGIKFGYDPVGESGGASLAAVGQAPEGGAIGGPGFSFSSAPSATSAMMMGLKIGRYSRLVGLDFELELMENEEKGKVIASPKVITQNKKKAVIKSTEYLPYLSQTDSESGTVEWKELEASMDLTVTPQITNDGSIILEVELSKQEFKSIPSTLAKPVARTARNVKTNVLVDNGNTVVIGGIYKEINTSAHSGIPFLKDIPIIGWLFRSPDRINRSKSEMVIFITPRIINQEEAGLIDQNVEQR